MPGFRGRTAFGLRGRIIGVVLVTTVATLGIAALALLGPLEHSLRKAEQATLQRDLGRKTIRSFRQLPPLDEVQLPQVPRARSCRNSTTGSGQRRSCTAIPAPTVTTAIPSGRPAPSPSPMRAPTPAPPYSAAPRRSTSFISVGENPYVQAVIPFKNAVSKLPYALVVSKPIDQISGAVGVVRRAFLDAALAGLALTLDPRDPALGAARAAVAPAA